MAHHVIVFNDGTVGIMETVEGVTPEECLAKWHPDQISRVVSHQPIDLANIPTDRTRRDDWRLVGDHIEIVDPP